METKAGQRDFSGGLNTNPVIAENELQECTNVDLRDFGKVKPAYQDTLIKTQAGITCIGVADGYVYYLVDDALSRIKAGNDQSIGTIGKGVFFTHKWGDMHLTVASDKTYKVLDGALSALGTVAPATAPTVTLEAQKEKVIDDMEDHTTWTVSVGDAKADDAVNVKVDAKSMKITPAVANELGYLIKSISIDLTQYADGTESEDSDFIAMWVYINTPKDFTSIQIVFDINTGDYKNDLYMKTVPIVSSSNNLINEDLPQTFIDPVKNINLDDTYKQWDNRFFPDSLAEFKMDFLGRAVAQANLVAKLTTKKISVNLGQGAWTQIKIRKNEFLRFGTDSTKDWSNVVAVKLTATSTVNTCEISFDDLKLLGGGKLDQEKYRLSYSYVSKFYFDDGTLYQEESQLSPEVEITSADRQNIIVTDIADSSDSQVTHKRVYIRGGGLELRHLAGEVATGTTTLTTDKDEEELVIEIAEDCRKNAEPPIKTTHSEIVNSRLFFAKKRILSWSRTNIPYGYYSLDNIVLPSDIKAIYRKGSNLAVLLINDEVIFVNPGYGATEGGYLHYAEDPQGCMATRSAEKGFHLAEEGMVFFTGQTPQIISDKIRSELLGYSFANRQDAIGDYLRGSYYLCVPGDSIMYSFEKTSNRYIKHDTIIDVSAGDDGDLYILKSDGIYSFQTDTTKRKSFAIRSQDIVWPEDSANRQLYIDCDFGSDPVTVDYYIGDTVKSSKTFTTSGREKKLFPVTQEPGYRFSVRISRAAETTYVDTAIYGVFLQ